MPPVAAPTANPHLPAAPPQITSAQAARVALRHLDLYRDVEFTAMDVRRTEIMFASARVTPQHVVDTLRFLEAPEGAIPWADSPRSSDRRAVLAAMLSVSVGFNHPTALALVDDVRDLKNAEIAAFLGSLALGGATFAGGLYGSYLACCSAATGVAAKASAMKAGGMTALGYLGAGAATGGWLLLGTGAVLVGGKIVDAGLRMEDELVRDHANVLEPKSAKDRRLWQGIKRGAIAVADGAQ